MWYDLSIFFYAQPCHIFSNRKEVAMYSMVMTSMLEGIHAVPVRVEVDIRPGLPSFDMVGFLSSEVREAKERVKTALYNCGIVLPAKRITVNLSPANIKKSGTGFDVCIAVAILLALELVDEKQTLDTIFTGELNLRGDILPVRGILPMVNDGKQLGFRRFVLPKENLCEAGLVKEVNLYGFSHLSELISFLKGTFYDTSGKMQIETNETEHTNDFEEVNGQHFLRRAAEVAASGMHNMLLVGPPGAGKTMISERIATILPPLTEEECLELTKIYSVCGLLDAQKGLIRNRPFRSPHHTITKAGLVGGGMNLRPGEISLAHHGVLFLDELTEFDKSTLEVLRQPLEEHEITISRANGSVTYPSNILLLAAMNPCPCGYYPNMQKCRCTPATVGRYLGRISQPLLDRMDLCVEAPVVPFEELTTRQKNESSAEIRARVNSCHLLQQKRFEREPFKHNSQIPSARIREFCPLGEKEQSYMEKMFEKMNLTARAYHKILRVARTIADMDENAQILLRHLQEAVCYRSVNEKFWGGH